MPEINAAKCAAWSSHDKNAYIDLEHDLSVFEVQRRRMPDVSAWKQFATQPYTYKQNAGTNQQLLISEPPAIIRQHAYGTPICEQPLVDRTSGRQRTVNLSLYHHEFQSPRFCWCPEYFKFATETAKLYKYIVESQEYFLNMFFRSFILHQTPQLLIADGLSSSELSAGSYVGGLHTGAPIGAGNDAGTSGKTLNYLTTATSLIGPSGHLSMSLLNRALDYAVDIEMRPYKAGERKENMALDDKYLLLVSDEGWRQLAQDPYYRENRDEREDVIRAGFKGPICGGRVIGMTHDNPLRLARTNAGVVSWPAFQTTVEDPTDRNYGRAVRTVEYNTADIEFAFLLGAKGFLNVNPGPPPKGFKGLLWNGKPELTDKFLIPCAGAPGNVEYNTHGEFLRWDGKLIYGAGVIDDRQCIVIMYKRTRGLRTLL